MLYAIYAPQNRDRVKAGISEEMARALKDGFTESEVATAKRALLQARRIARARTPRSAGGLANQAYLGRTWDYAAKIDAAIEAVTVAKCQRSAAQIPESCRLRVVVRRRLQGAVTRERRRSTDVISHISASPIRSPAMPALTMFVCTSSSSGLLKTFDDKWRATIFHWPAFLITVVDQRESSLKKPRAIG
jgi:hypothetical protein